MRAPIIALLVLLVVSPLAGCATRTVNETVVESHKLEVRLRSEKATFGRAVVARGFDQPVEISAARLSAILGGIQIDMRKSDKSAIRERRYAIPPKILKDVSAGVSKALAKASPDQEIVVLALRKQMQKGVFNRKYLTSFVVYVQEGDLHVHFARIDWKTEQHRQGDKLPAPQVGSFVMPFDTVQTDIYRSAGRQGVRVDWRSEAFGAEAIREQITAAPSVEPLADEQPEPVAAEEPEASDEAEAAPNVAAPSTAAADAGAATAGAAAGATAAGAVAAEPVVPDPVATPSPSAADPIRGLTSDDLRKLADLEDARAAGRISAADYEAERQAILGAAR